MMWTLTRGSGLGGEDCQQHGNYCIMSTLVTLLLPHKYFTTEYVRNESSSFSKIIVTLFIHSFSYRTLSDNMQFEMFIRAV